MKKALLISIALLLLIPASVGASVFATRLSWHSDGPWSDCWPGYRSWHGRRRPYWSDGPWPRYVRVEKRESVVSELRRKDAENRQAWIEKTKHYNQKYKKTHGEYPVRQVIFSPNHPAAP